LNFNSGLNLFAQHYTSKLIDADDKTPVAFANIGILNSEMGTNSAEDGSFSLNIPQELTNRTLSIFLIGYEDLKLPVSEFIELSKSSNNTLQLKKKANQLSEVLVKPAKLTVARLGNHIDCEKNGSMLPFPYVLEEKKKNNGKIKRAADTLTEVGTLMKVKKRKTYIDSITIHVGSCTYPEILFRVNIYELVDGAPKNILTEPLYIKRSGSEVDKILKIDVTDRNLVVNNNFIVSVEKVKDLGKGIFNVCGSLAGAPTYLRIASQQTSFFKIPLVSFGISAYVTFSEELKD